MNNQNDIERQLSLRVFFRDMPDPYDSKVNSKPFGDWIEENLDRFWTIIEDSSVNLYYIQYAKPASGEKDNNVHLLVLGWLSLDESGTFTRQIARLPQKVKVDDFKDLDPASLSWAYPDMAKLKNSSTFFFQTVYDFFMKKDRLKIFNYKILDDRKLKTSFGSLLADIIGG